MSVERYWRWTCDGCGRFEQRADYGFPAGWIFVKGKAITHRCPECADSIPEQLRGQPKATAQK